MFESLPGNDEAKDETDEGEDSADDGKDDDVAVQARTIWKKGKKWWC